MRLRELPWTVLIAAFFVLSIPAAMAGDHPEHPASKKHAPPKQPVADEKPTVELEDVATHIEQWVAGQNDGKYVIEDTHARTTLTLSLDKIHRERLSHIGGDTYFVCADFKTAEGKVYDLDFFVKGTSKNDLGLVADKTSVHKESGQARYTWHEADGVWKKKTEGDAGEHPKGEHPAKKEGKTSEHPEHPK